MTSDAIAQFCAYLQRRNYSPHTIDNYGRELRLFFYAGGQGAVYRLRARRDRVY